MGDQTVAYHGTGAGKKGQVSLFVAEEIVESSATTDFQICHLSWHLSYKKEGLAREREREGVRKRKKS